MADGHQLKRSSGACYAVTLDKYDQFFNSIRELISQPVSDAVDQFVRMT